MEKPFTWIVRFDVAPTWVEDGFTLSDDAALEMLSGKLAFADGDSELAASVIAGPSPLRIAREQGYDPKHAGSGVVVREVMAGAPRAYSTDSSATTLVRTLEKAIVLLDGAAFVRHDNDNTGVVLSELRDALAMITGTEALAQSA